MCFVSFSHFMSSSTSMQLIEAFLSLLKLIGTSIKYLLLLLAHFCCVEEGLDSWLLPIRLPNSNEDYEIFIREHRKLLNDNHKNAIKYLRLALYSTPAVSAALLPLIQVNWPCNLCLTFAELKS